MHNALFLLLSIPFISSTSTTCSAHIVPLPPPPDSSSLAQKCTFTLWHKQLLSHPPAQKTNYIQINTLTDHANQLTMDISHLRPTGAFHSYSKICANQVFAIEGLLEGRNLTVRGDDGRDEVRFESDGVGWTSEGGGGDNDEGVREAWCEAGAWDESRSSRERRMECAFPCEKIEGDEVESEVDEEERVELR